MSTENPNACQKAKKDDRKRYLEAEAPSRRLMQNKSQAGKPSRSSYTTASFPAQVQNP